MNKIVERLGKSFSKFLFPILYKIFFFFKINKRAANYFNEKSFFSNNKQNFKDVIKSLLEKNKIIAKTVNIQSGKDIIDKSEEDKKEDSIKEKDLNTEKKLATS